MPQINVILSGVGILLQPLIHGLIDHIYHTKQKNTLEKPLAADNGAAAVLYKPTARSP